jgi:hypothetical protein
MKIAIESVLAPGAAERNAQLDLLHSIFIPWLVTLSGDDEPMARVARMSALSDGSAALVNALIPRRLSELGHRAEAIEFCDKLRSLPGLYELFLELTAKPPHMT